MLMNLGVDAVVTVLFPNNKKKKIREKFNLWQTPTEVTKRIPDSNDFLYEYSKWISNFDCGMGDEHIEDLKTWLKDHEDWKIEWYMF